MSLWTFGVFMGQRISGAALFSPPLRCQIAATLQQIQNFNKRRIFNRLGKNLSGKLSKNMFKIFPIEAKMS